MLLSQTKLKSSHSLKCMFELLKQLALIILKNVSALVLSQDA